MSDPDLPPARPERRVIDEGSRHADRRDGTWFYHGSPINRLPLVKLFASVLRREADGEYWLVTPVERGRVQVEDAPFTAVEPRCWARAALIFVSHQSRRVGRGRAGAADPGGAGDERSGPRPYVLVREGLEALI